MKEHLLKRALPFALTFAVGAAVGGFFQLFGARGGRDGRVWEHSRTYRGRYGCNKKFRRAYVPDQKPPVILFKPDARWPSQLNREHPLLPRSVRVRVTFGDDGKVRAAEPLDGFTVELCERAERAARQIQFLPATVDNTPVTATEEVEIRFSFE